MAALGTDTGNSVRGPSSHNALVGLRPSLGLMSRTGIVPLRLDRDTPGQRACHSLGKAGAGAGAVATSPPPPAAQLSSAHMHASLPAAWEEDMAQGAGRPRDCHRHCPFGLHLVPCPNI